MWFDILHLLVNNVLGCSREQNRRELIDGLNMHYEVISNHVEFNYDGYTTKIYN
jgi:hypothetical protein